MRAARFLLFGTLFVVVLILTVHPPLSFSSDESPPPEVISAAQQGIGTFVKAPQARNLHMFGFSTQQLINGAILGQGFQVFSISPAQLLAQGSSQELDALALPTNLWQFLIVTGGKPASLLTVDLFEGQWTAVSIGASGLATELASLLEAWPPSSGYRYRLIKVYQAKSDFMEIFQGEQTLGMVPFTSGRIALGLKDREFNPLDILDSREILTKLRPIVRLSVQ